MKCPATGGTEELRLRTWQGVAVPFPTPGGRGEVQEEMLEEETVSVPTTGGTGQLLYCQNALQY